VLHKPSVEEEEGAKGIRGGLAKLEVQQILSGAICLSFCMLDQSMFVQCFGGRSRMCVSCAQEISPTLILLPIFIWQRKNRTRALSA
jgi:hypothetical protein